MWAGDGSAATIVILLGYLALEVVPLPGVRGLPQDLPGDEVDDPHRGEGRELWLRGHLALVVHPTARVVITVLLNARQEWTDRDCRDAFREISTTSHGGPEQRARSHAQGRI